MTASIVPGSVAHAAARANKSIAQTFLSVDLVALVDVSGSMESPDSQGGKTRYAQACAELTKLQAQYPGKVGIIAFSNTAHFVPGGVPPMLGGGTNLEAALEMAKKADGVGPKFCVISDGFPDDPDACLRIAKTFNTSISTIHVGPEGDVAGQEFLVKLANATGGTHERDARVSVLGDKLRPMLTAGVTTPA